MKALTLFILFFLKPLVLPPKLLTQTHFGAQNQTYTLIKQLVKIDLSTIKDNHGSGLYPVVPT